MCMLCLEIQKGMAVKEVARAYNELDIEQGHQSELLGKLLEYSDVDELFRELKGLGNSDDKQN